MPTHNILVVIPSRDTTLSNAKVRGSVSRDLCFSLRPCHTRAEILRHDPLTVFVRRLRMTCGAIARPRIMPTRNDGLFRGRQRYSSLALSRAWSM